MLKELKFKKVATFLLPIVVLVVFISYGLRSMPRMIPQGEGFIWLTQAQQISFWHNLPGSLGDFEVSAVIFGTFLSHTLGFHLHAYYWFWLIVMLVIDVLIYLLVFVITQNKSVSFSAALIFGVNFISQWGYIGWTYTSLLERTFTVLFLLPSFLFLHLSLSQEKYKYFFISIVLFIIGVELGQWGLIFGGAFICYPIIWFFYHDLTKVKLVKSIIIGLSFLIVCLFFLELHYVNQSEVGPKESFIKFIIQPQKNNYLAEIPVQLAIWSNYPNLLKGIYVKINRNGNRVLDYKGSLLENFSDAKANIGAANGIAVVYLLIALVIYIKLTKYRPLLITLILAICSIFIVNIYFGRYFPDSQPGSSRYMYLPSIWLSIFWALFLWVFFEMKPPFNILGVFILVGYYLINISLLSSGFYLNLDSKNSTYPGTITLFDFISKEKWSDNTLIVTPWDELGCGEDGFLNDQFKSKNVIFSPIYNNCGTKWEDIAKNKTIVVKLGYNKDCSCVTEEKLK